MLRLTRALTLLAVLLAACSGDDLGEQARTDVDVTGIDDIVVKNGDENQPPRLHKVGNKEVQVGEELSLVLAADDDDGDQVTFSVYGDLPPEARFYKPEGRFEWRPEAVGGPWFVTFVVSDSKDFDSETVELKAVSTKTQHAPQFETIGDQVLAVGELFELRLEATDQDGDMLYFTAKSGMPAGATFDAQNALFRWTPQPSDAGAQARVTFVVSDGALSDEVEVRFVVAGGDLTNHPPEVEPIGSVEAEPGQKVSFTVKASDPDGDKLSFAVETDLPSGASFESATATFSWVPPTTYAGKTLALVVAVSDGSFTVKVAADVLVKKKGAACGNDEFEPNNEAALAAQVTQGTFAGLSICDTDTSPIDEDWFKVLLTSGEHLEATVASDHALGNLDLLLYTADNLTSPAFYAPVDADVEKLSFDSPAAGTYYLRVVGTDSWQYAVPYVLTIERKSGSGCTPDGNEPNETKPAATLLAGEQLQAVPLTDLTICPGDLDVFKMALQPGDSAIASIEHDAGAGDLDLYLFDVDGETDLDQAATAKDIETVTLDGAAVAGNYYLVVVGYPAESTSNSYSLEVLVEAGNTCAADAAEPNDSAGAAAPLAAGETAGLTLCGDPDFFALPAGPGEVSVTVTSAAATLSAWFVLSSAPGDKLAMPCAGGSCTGIKALPAQGTLYLEVAGSFGAAYSVNVAVEGALAGDSCAGKCDENPGDCWCDGQCHEFGDCCADVCEECGYCTT